MSLARFIPSLLRAIFWEDWLLKGFCMVSAVLLWIYIDGELTESREFPVSVPVSELKLPPGLELAEDSPPLEIQVRIFGARRRLQNLKPDQVHFELPDGLASAVPGKNTLKITSGVVRIDGAPGLTAVNIQPNELYPKLSGVYQKRLPIKTQLRGTPRESYRVEMATVEPEKEVIVTSAQDLESADFIWTEPIDIEGKFQDMRLEKVPLAQAQAGERKIEVRPLPPVTVILKFKKEEVTRTLTNVPIQALSPPGTAMIVEPAAVNVQVRGGENVAALRNADVHLCVEWPADWDLKRTPDQPFPLRTLQVQVFAPPGVVVRGENGQELPSVRITGVISGALQKP